MEDVANITLSPAEVEALAKLVAPKAPVSVVEKAEPLPAPTAHEDFPDEDYSYRRRPEQTISQRAIVHFDHGELHNFSPPSNDTATESDSFIAEAPATNTAAITGGHTTPAWSKHRTTGKVSRFNKITGWEQRRVVIRQRVTAGLVVGVLAAVAVAFQFYIQWSQALPPIKKIQSHSH